MSQEPGDCMNEECITQVTLGALVVGVCLTFISVFWPISNAFVIDPYLSAEENEKRQAEHARAVFTLHVMAVIGMGLLTLAAIVTSILLTKMLLVEEFLPRWRRKNRKKKKREQSGGQFSEWQGESSGRQRPLQQQQQIQQEQRGNSEISTQHSHQLTPTDQDDVKLVNSDQLEMNRDFQIVSTYGSFAK